ncbi:MAG: VWA domain-containing protein [Acidobacteriota bacterium]
MSRGHRLAGLIAVLASVGTIVVAQEPIFRGGTDTVLLSVTVNSPSNRPTPTLGKQDFQVFEDGTAQEVSIFSHTPQPIALSILLDSSTSMEDKLPVAQEAAIGFARSLGKNDVAQIVEFNNDTRIRQTFTHDADALERAIRQIHTGGSTSLNNAIYIALTELGRIRAEAPDEIRRQAIVVLSDGEDTTSLVSYDQLIDLSKRSAVSIYTIGLREKRTNLPAHYSDADFVLRTLSQATGGRVFFVDDVKQLSVIYGQIADELANQYTLGYSSKNVKRDGAWRSIAVRVNHPDTSARTRSGYFGPSKGH